MSQQTLRLDLLGGFRAFLDESPIEGFISNKSRALLAYLFITRKPQPRQVLAELLWGDKPDEVANSNLRMALSNLRSVAGSHLAITRNEVAIREQSPFLLDVETFRSKLGSLSISSVESAATELEQGIALYKGEFLEGFHVRDADGFEEWALRQRERCRQLALSALFRLSSHHTERGNYAAALDYTSRLLALEPWQEEGHRQMMLLLALSGNRSAALAQYETCRRILAEELHVQPLPETNALLARIKAMPGSPQQPASQTANQSKLFGRQEEHAWLLRQWKAVQQGQGTPSVTLIEGEMGIGKTSLVEEVLRYVTTDGALVIRARCHEFGNEMPYQSVVDLLRMALDRQPESIGKTAPVWRAELAALLPELYDKVAGIKNNLPAPVAEVARHRLFESVCQYLHAVTNTPDSCSGSGAGEFRHETLAAPKLKTKQSEPALAGKGIARERWLVIFIDDMQWVDAATVDMLRYLAYRLTDCPVWLVCAYQSEGMETEHPFLRLRRGLVGEGRANVLRLDRLPSDAMAEWIRALPGLQDDQVQQLADYAVRRSEGNPFIASQILKDLRENASLKLLNGTWHLGPSWSPQDAFIPFAVREIVLLKIGRLSAPARNLLCEAAAIGESFDLSTLQQALGLSQDITGHLVECQEQGLITPAWQGTYRFTHTMIREIAYERLSPWHRMQVSGRLGAEDLTSSLLRVSLGSPAASYS